MLTLHEIVIRGNDAWVTANKNIPMNLSKYGGAYNGALIDSAVQEYNLTTGKLVRSWDALDHIPLSDSQATLPTNGFPWDAYHVNSIDLPGDGTFVVSMRNTWAAYKVNIKTGTIEWTLGGRHSSFKFGPGADFQWQHDVSVYPGSTAAHDVRRPLLPDHRRRHLRERRPPPRADWCSSSTPQNAHRHARGPVQPRLRTSTPSTWAASSRWPTATSSSAGDRRRSSPSTTPRATCCSTRACRVTTSATGPRSSRGSACRCIRRRAPPAGRGGQDHRVRELERRHPGRLVEGARRTARRLPVATAPRSGFETAIPVSQSYKTFKVQALAANGRVLGTSAQFTVGG